MAKVDFQPQRPHELLGIYPDEVTAERVIVDLRENAQVGAHLGTHQDEQHALNAEMSEEIKQSWISPQGALLVPKEGARTASAMFPLLLVASLVVAIPLSFLWRSEISAGGRAALAGGVALIMAGTITLVLMSLGQKRPNEAMAAEEGVIVRADIDRPDVRELMLAAQPLRLDVVDDEGRPIETLATKGDSSSPREIGKRMNQWP